MLLTDKTRMVATCHWSYIIWFPYGLYVHTDITMLTHNIERSKTSKRFITWSVITLGWRGTSTEYMVHTQLQTGLQCIDIIMDTAYCVSPTSQSCPTGCC